jgi:light-regulated signal transduction histidine kinase (bacteriophytochrome)
MVEDNLESFSDKEKVRLLTQKLHRAQKEVNEFARIISHDLKAPLRGISSLATWLLEDNFEKLDEEGKQNLLLLQERVEKMDVMIDGILTYSSVSKGEKKIEEIDLGKVLNAVIQTLEKPDNFEIIVESELPVIKANNQHVYQLFHNLLSNAVNFNDKQDGKVWITVRPLDNMREFSVKDNGRGISYEHQDKIFNIFQTLATKDPKPSGIGLAIVKKIVELYDGEIWVESEPGFSTTFKFTLPVEPNLGNR